MTRVAAVLAVVPAVVVAACGGASGPSTTPNLPPQPEAKAPAATAPPEDKDPWAGRTDLIASPPAAAPAPIVLPAATRFTLPNGLKVIVVPIHDLPVVSLRLIVGAGAIDEPRDKRGLAGFVAAMLNKGAGKRNAVQIAEQVAAVGGVLDVTSDLENTYLSCQALAKDAATCVDLVGDVVVAPTFPAAEFGPVADNVAASVRYVHDNPPALAAAHAENTYFGEDHPRGWPVTEETIKAIARKDVLAWHKARFVPANAELAIAGDVDPAAVRAAIAKAFGRWAGAKPPARKPFADPTHKGITVRIVDRPDATQSHIMILGDGVAHKDADFIPAILVNDALGGPGLSSRLNRTLRTDGGLTYGANSSFESWKARGLLQVAMATRNLETGAALKAILEGMKKLREEGPTAEELAQAKSRIAGHYPMTFQSVTDLATAFLVADAHELGEEWVRSFPVAVGAVTMEQARAAAKAHIDPENAVVIVVGKGDDIAPQVTQLGLTAERVGWLDPVSKRDRDRIKKVALDPQKTAEGKKLLDAALAAKGGAARLRGLKDMVAVGTVRMTVNKQVADGKWRRVFIPPTRMRVDFELPGGSVTLVSTEKGAWQRINKQVQDLDRALADQAQAQIWREVDTILLRHLEPGTIVQSAGKVSVPGETKAFDAVVIRRADGTNETRILLDPETRLIFALLYAVGGTPALERYSDYRDVSGLQIPFRQQASGANQILDVIIADVKVNGGVPADMFVKQ
jgi:predicted Zn-dependent peptidase